ncbi:hypothetical protein HMPREF2976_00005 [Corynebacterium sp. HMSC077D10]|uniref:hypothetical protein n=1 Tax=Corynebacterium TaxID=1716 RepID=UPI000839C699|nr:MULTISPECIES: hypothetical protein [Corynebacterium]OFL78046.1 hypothetical protein HMPREF2748_02535 [Corynebacterium sp. HMSC077B05]OFP71194.1 hypothetical protein HMPREF2976_00005 [Corynebacterium sp. HMSC077D10]
MENVTTLAADDFAVLPDRAPGDMSEFVYLWLNAHLPMSRLSMVFAAVAQIRMLHLLDMGVELCVGARFAMQKNAAPD